MEITTEIEMSNKQLTIPGLPVPQQKVKKPTLEKRLRDLEIKVLSLEMELTLIKLQLEDAIRW